MKLARFGEPGAEKPAVEIDGRWLDCSAYFADWNREFFNSDGLSRLSALVKDEAGSLPEVVPGSRTGAPIARPGKVVCIGLNYSDHAEESGMPIPTEPIVFLKASNTVMGPYDTVLLPRRSEKTDWEVELGVVIGKDARYLTSADETTSFIAGYVLSHDVSEREFQLERGGQWTKGKSCDTFNPLGPFLATQEEIKDPQRLSMGLTVNGAQRQTGTTARMIFPVHELVHYLSQFMTLEAGDLISTGTPPGVGLGMKPPQYLREGDVVELWIDGLGRQRQECRRA